jgi:predicted dehydrogenase
MNTHKDSSTSRRHFIKTSSAVAVTGALAPYLSFPEKAFAANSDTLRIGLIGCGGRGTGAAGQALKADKNVILTAVADVFKRQCESALGSLKNDAALKDRVQVDPDHTFVGLDAYQKLINSGVDVVLLATPPGFRPEHFKAAVEAGKQIFTEKPMATDTPGVRSIMQSVELAKKKKLSIVAGFCWRYEYGRREFYRRIHDGALGDIRAIYATYLTSPVKPMPRASERPPAMSDLEWQLRNWYNFVWICGDGLVEQACHSIDKIAWAMKDVPPLKAVATGGRQVPNNEGNIYDHIDVFYEYADGVRAFMAQRQMSNCYSDNSDYLMGANGTGTIKGSNPPIIQARQSWRYDGPKNDMYQTEHDEFFASIRKGEPINDGDWMAKSTLMAIMGRTAAYTGQEITWEQALNLQEKLVPDNLDWNMKLPVAPMAIPGKTKLA